MGSPPFLPQTVVVIGAAEPVAEHDQCKADNTLEHAHSCCIAVFAALETTAVYIGTNHVAGFHVGAVLQQQDGLIAGIHDMA